MASKKDIDNQKEYNKELERTNSLRHEEVESAEDIRGKIRATITELSGANELKSNGLKIGRQLQGLSEKLIQDLYTEEKLNLKQLEGLQASLGLKIKLFEADIESLKITIDQVKAQKGVTEELEKQLKTYEGLKVDAEDLESLTKKRIKGENDVAKAQGLTGGLVGGLAGILDKMGATKISKALGIDEALADSKKFTAGLIDGGAKAGDLSTKVASAKNLAGSIGKNLTKSLGPQALVAELLMGIMRADEETTELGKSMAMTKGESTLFRENLAEAARDSGNMALTGTKIVANFNALNKELGFINNFTMDTLVTMTKLTEQVGLSAKEAGGLVQLSEARGANAEDEYKSALSVSYELQKQSGIQQDLREILKGISTITGQLRANLGANTVEMAKAVTLAGELGGTLDDVKTISSSILDFESSIQNELSAELLTGKSINLEKARQFALTGDIVNLEKEIADQLGTFTEFSKMNVIQQEAMAKAFGLSSDRLSDMLFKQQIQGRSAKELRDAGEDDLARMVEQQDMQDKFNQTVEKLKSIFTDVGQAFMPVLEVLGFALSLVGLIVGLVTDLLSMLKGDFDFSATTAAASSLGGQLFGGDGGAGHTSNGA